MRDYILHSYSRTAYSRSVWYVFFYGAAIGRAILQKDRGL